MRHNTRYWWAAGEHGEQEALEAPGAGRWRAELSARRNVGPLEGALMLSQPDEGATWQTVTEFVLSGELCC